MERIILSGYASKSTHAVEDFSLGSFNQVFHWHGNSQNLFQAWNFYPALQGILQKLSAKGYQKYSDSCLMSRLEGIFLGI